MLNTDPNTDPKLKRKPPTKPDLYVIRATPTLRAQLNELSAALGVPRAEIVRRAVARMAQTA